jgi:hypothetical protein
MLQRSFGERVELSGFDVSLKLMVPGVGVEGREPSPEIRQFFGG